MNDDPGEAPIDATVSRRRSRISPVWLIPLGAALVGCWLLYQNVISRGPEVTLMLDTAEGLEAGQTAIKVRSVEVGHVESVRLTDNYSGAVATLQMNPGTGDLLATDTVFWVVKPRVGRQGISGLGTILSGAYIKLQPGTAEEVGSRFTALDHPPVTAAGAPGVSIILTSDGDNALNVGDPVIYQGQSVGLIEAAEFSVEEKRMKYRVFIQAPFDKIVTQATQFWLRSGIDVHIGADGVDIQTGSLQTIFAGGVTFGLPEDVEPGSQVQDGATFKLYPTRSAARQERYDQQIPYLVLLEDSVRGLYVGAPVLYRGIRIGTVNEVPFFTDDYDFSQRDDFKIPVLIAIEPQRITNWIDWTPAEWRRNMQRFFENGLRATIKSANLLTGAMFISLQFDDSTSGYTPRKLGTYPVFPSKPGAISNIQQQIAALLEKFNNLEIQGLANELQSTLDAIETATRSLNRLFNADGTRDLAGELQRTLSTLRDTLAAYQQGAPIYQQLNQSLDRLNRVLDDIAPLAETLSDNPNALIFGPDPSSDPVPQAAQ